MGLVSVRLDDEDERFIRRKRLPLSDVIREAVRHHVRQWRALEALDELENTRFKLDERSEDIIRSLRAR